MTNRDTIRTIQIEVHLNEELLHTLLGIEDVRESAAQTRAMYARLAWEPEIDLYPDLTEREILANIAWEGPMSSRHLRMCGPVGVVATSEALERLARAGVIAADAEGKWRLS